MSRGVRLVGALTVVGSVAGAVLTRSSWWALPFLVAVVVTTAGLRGVVPVAYREGWTRSTVIVSLIAACVAGLYAFAVAPLGPSPVAYVFVGLLLLFVLVVVRDAAQVFGSDDLQQEWGRSYMEGGRRR